MNNTQRAYYALKKFYGYDSFREGQLEIINKILNKIDSFILMPTGGGKSICYQIPSIIFEGITLVISPLISLMKDQVDSLKESGINGIYINSSLKSEEIKEILKDASLGLYKIIYISPERLESNYFKNIIKDLNICHIAIDEAHCVSEWGHDFRKSYRYIKPFYESLKNRPVISAFTATATKEVREDAIKLLGLNNPYEYLGDINRSNLNIDILKEVDKEEELKTIIRSHEDESGIVYCMSRKEVDIIYSRLNDIGYSVLKYHAGMREEDKEKSQEDFLFERKNVMIATNAFGMGIDKSNVRFIVHASIPKNLETYYQEIGRGGRDGEQCDCYLFYSRDDIRRVEFLINKSSGINRREIALRKLQEMVEYAESKDCYRNYLLKYFGNKYITDFCNNCSNCLNSDEIKDFTREAQIILSTIFRTRERFGISVLIDILRGIKGPKVINYELDKVTTYGLMKEYSSNFIKSIIKNLLELKYIDLKPGTYSMLILNNRSMKVLKSEEKVFMKLEKMEDEVINKDIYNALKSWRKIKAIKENIRPYIIFSDRTLIDISNIKPENKESLMNIRGMGEKKLQKYGEEILELIRDMNKN
ncbi:ATP-dependent DNA helicase RecQ [Clostridium baratii str. Sullivan]|uniref:DNA helicase RecQ n=1 Tax=Clostridium baratii str. Sullivan TaxID=1415775 RepID=A0A0A7G013_9CLOT|nr:DNA helicase RecQ [Clostridium baratii]AIY84515.1 ATP-dependent DNA helicase RecQ [Clostridium baratii str. Sullivan]